MINVACLKGNDANAMIRVSIKPNNVNIILSLPFYFGSF